MGPGLVSFLFAVGASAWIFNKFQKYSGNNTQQSAIATGISALLIFIILFYILNSIL